jgi:hypothetical protein
MFKKFIKGVDKIVCTYLGLTGEEREQIQSIKIIENNIVLFNNNPFHRSKSVESWQNFSNYSVHKTDCLKKQKIGLAAGKAIAKNLVISFENTDITEKQ